MKANQIIFTVLLLFLGVQVSIAQNIITVGPQQGMDYAGLQDAIDAASAGDIIHVYPSGASYGNIIIEKQLAIYGMGYFLGENPTPTAQATIGETRLGSVTFLTNAASNSILQGFTVTSNIRAGNNTAGNATHNIMISHCYLYGYFGGTGSNLTVSRCYIISGTLLTSAYQLTGVTIKNNIWRPTHSNVTINTAGGTSGASGIQFVNNTVNLAHPTATTIAIRATNTVLTNNIIVSESGTVDIDFQTAYLPTSYSYNITNDTDGDLFVNCSTCSTAAATALMVGFPDPGSTSQDSRYALKANSPAIDFSASGEDIGAFGGSTPYRLSGIPDIPNIYYLDVPSSGSAATGLNVRIKAKANQ